MPRSATEDGRAAEKAAEDCREKDYPDVHLSPHAQLLSVGCETYGRWGKSNQVLVRTLTKFEFKMHQIICTIQLVCYSR